MTKYYRVKKETPIWEKGAIVKNEKESDRYDLVSDLFITNELFERYYECFKVVENSPEWFERVYPVNLLTKTVYKIKEEAKTLLENDFKE